MSAACDRCGTFFAAGSTPFERAGKKYCPTCYGVILGEVQLSEHANRVRLLGYTLPFVAVSGGLLATLHAVMGAVVTGSAGVAALLLAVKLLGDEPVRGAIGRQVLPVFASLAVTVLLSGGAFVAFALGFVVMVR